MPPSPSGTAVRGLGGPRRLGAARVRPAAGDWAGVPLQGRGELGDQPVTGRSRRTAVSADGLPSGARVQSRRAAEAPPAPTLPFSRLRWSGGPPSPQRHDCPRAAGAGCPFRGAGNCATSPRRAAGGGGSRRTGRRRGRGSKRVRCRGAARARPCRLKRHGCPRAAGAGRLFRGAGNCATGHEPPAPDALGGQAPSARPSARRNPSVVSLSRTARRSHSSSRPGNVSPRRVA